MATIGVKFLRAVPWYAWLAAYISLGLNLPVFWRRFLQLQDGLGALGSLGRVTVEALLVLATSLLLMAALQLGGRRLGQVLGSAFLVISVVASYYMALFQVVIGFGVMQAVLTTDIDLSKESVGLGMIGWVLVFALPVLWWVWRSEPIRVGAMMRLKRVLVTACTGGLLFYVSYATIDRVEYPVAEHPDSQTVVIKPSVLVAHSYLPSNWLAGLSMSLANDFSHWRSQSTLADPATLFSYHPTAPLDDVLLVIVIGESARSNNFGLLGYERQTTPLLSKKNNLVVLAGQSCNTSTKLSLQCMFVRPEAVYEHGLNRPVVSERPVFSVLKKLGFSIELFAMQSEVWFYNSVLAEYYKIREVIASDPKNHSKPSHDGLLLDEVAASLKAQASGPRALVLHTKGSHFLYTSRYPREFAQFKPECNGIDKGCSHAQLSNSYDNSILYLDHFLDQLTNQLHGKKALLIYTSDHGESIGENIHFHATPKQLAPPEQLAVPLIIWASPQYLQHPVRADLFKTLQAQQVSTLGSAPPEAVGHHNLFDTLLGCLGVVSPDGGIKPTLDLCR
jgi:KDO II ethanolaminephosphotransferase